MDASGDEKKSDEGEILPARRRDTKVDVSIRVDVARVVLAIGAAVALIIAAANGVPMPPIVP